MCTSYFCCVKNIDVSYRGPFDFANSLNVLYATFIGIISLLECFIMICYDM